MLQLLETGIDAFCRADFCPHNARKKTHNARTAHARKSQNLLFGYISMLFQISLWSGQFSKLVGGYFNKSALGDAEASPKLGTQCTNARGSPGFSENRVGLQIDKGVQQDARISRCQCKGACGEGREGQKDHGTTRFPEARLDFPKTTRNPSERLNFENDKE